MKVFREWNPRQEWLLPPSIPLSPHDWLAPDHLVYCVLDLIEQLDLSGIEGCYQHRDARGEKGYHPGREVPGTQVAELWHDYQHGTTRRGRVRAWCTPSTDATANGSGDYANGKLQTATRHNWISGVDNQVVETYTYGGTGGAASQRAAPPPKARASIRASPGPTWACLRASPTRRSRGSARRAPSATPTLTAS